MVISYGSPLTGRLSPAPNSASTMTPPRGTAMDAVIAHGFSTGHLFTNSYRLAYLQDMLAHPIAMAAWFGLLVTSLNLLPTSQNRHRCAKRAGGR